LSRSLLIILVVAAISGWINGNERVASDAACAADWIRTADGWESREVLAPYEAPAPQAIHPAVVAGFQLLASLLVLAAFPARASVVRSRVSPRPRWPTEGTPDSRGSRRRSASHVLS
jgi:hypothetical protein